MKAFATAVSAALLLAGAASAQTAQTAPAQTPPAAATPARPTSDLTRDLNSGPPTIEQYLARPTTPAAAAPANVSSQPSASAADPAVRAPARPVGPGPNLPPSQPPPATARVVPIPTEPASPPRTVPITPGRTPSTPVAPPSERFTPPASASPATTTPAPSASTTRPTTTTAAPAASTPAPGTTRPATGATTSPAASPAAAAATAPAPAPAAPAVTVLDAAARAALPFSIDLPPGFEIVTGRPGPDFRIYAVRRGEKSFAMIYAGPASQFPIYSGEMVEAAGRASVVAVEDQQRHAMEHLFQRPTAPREVHVWTMSLDGADRALAERIAQSLDVR